MESVYNTESWIKLDGIGSAELFVTEGLRRRATIERNPLCCIDEYGSAQRLAAAFARSGL